MASNVRMPNGVDTDSVWPGRITSAIGGVNVRASNTQDFSDKYEKANGAGTSISANIRAPDGVDLSLKFTTQAANPSNWSTARYDAFGSPTEGDALATVRFTPNGQVLGNVSSGNWLTPNGPIGNQYQVLHTVISSTGSGTSFISQGAWFNLDGDVLLQISKGNVGTFTVNGSSQIRRKSDGAVVCSGPWTLVAQYSGS